jgi:pyocin large subunit-like protein
VSYKDLQSKAKELGIKHVGVSAEDLEKAIAEVEGSPKTSPKKNATETKDAVIFDGKHEVRTYSLEQHGKDYVAMAEQFISHPDRGGYTIKFAEVKSRVACPNCGHKFRHP